MPDKKKKVLILTDAVLAKTGFGKNGKLVIEHLYKTGKYEVVHLAVGSIEGSPDLDRTPWKTLATVNVQQLDGIKKQNDPRNWEGIERMAGYGAFAIDNAVYQEKPDVFIAIQDIWGIDFSVEKEWFKRVNSALWTTLDSLPILQKAIDLAPKVKNYWSWAQFATDSLHQIGHKHVKTLHGAVDCKHFYRLSDTERAALRKRINLPQDTFVTGFVFRNQLRKSVPNLLPGYSLFKKDNPATKTKLLLHTSWAEGWDIPKLMEEHKIPKEDILTTYVCKTCLNYDIKPFYGQEQDCPFCKTKKSLLTTHPTLGVSEVQLNEIYNLMDVYCHPFTSGGQEIPIQEAKLTELITLVTNYSCGEDSCVPEAHSLPLDWAEYREPGTQFIKASTYPSSIAKQLNKVLNMKEGQRREYGKKARDWVKSTFSIDVIGKVLEEFIDSSPVVDFDFKKEDVIKDPNYVMPQIVDDSEWLVHMYKNILKMDVDKENEGHKHWILKLKAGMARQEIEQYFRNVAFTENQKIASNKIKFEDLLNKDDKGRVIVVQPESAGDILLLTSLFKSIKNRYPEWSLYVSTKPEYRELLEGNPYMTKWIEYNPVMDNLLWLEGNSEHQGYFDVAYLPYLDTQRPMNFHTHNGVDKLDFNISE